MPSADPVTGAQPVFAGRGTVIPVLERCVLLEKPFKMASSSLSQGPRDTRFRDAWKSLSLHSSFAEDQPCLRSL